VWSSELAPAGCAEALAVVGFTRRLLFVDGVNDQQQGLRRLPPAAGSSYGSGSALSTLLPVRR
jgi:hypothetical protein